MAATLVLDTITSSGAGITIDATKTFTVNGELLTTGSTNVLHKTADYAIVTGDVAGKSELVVTTTTGAPRNITLPGLAVVGATTCVITIAISADATGTDSLRVQEGTTEVWTGYQKGDFVRFCISNGAWMILDHKETYYSRRYLTTTQALAAHAYVKWGATTEISEIGNMWDNANNKIIVPTGMSGWLDFSASIAVNNEYSGLGPYFHLDGNVLYTYYGGGGGGEGSRQNNGNVAMRIPVTTAQYLEIYCWNFLNSAKSIVGADAKYSQFEVTFTRTY